MPFKALADELQLQLETLVGSPDGFGWYHIGGVCNNGKWVWLDGSAWSYTRWQDDSLTDRCQEGQCLGTRPGRDNPDQIGWWEGFPCNEHVNSAPLFVCSNPGGAASRSCTDLV